MKLLGNISDKRLIIYVLIIIVCVVTIGIAVYFQFFYSSDMLTDINNENGESVESEEARNERLRTEFNLSFSNTIRKNSVEEKNIQRVDATRDIVYTIYEIDLYQENKYDINLNIPYLNIDSPAAKEINKEIDNIFGSKANDVIQSEYILSIYNLDYIAYLNDTILSILIKATLKEQDYPQRVIVKTYNYDIINNNIISLDDLLSKKNLDRTEVYNKTIKEIESVMKENELFAEAGYEVFKRDINDERYFPENTDTFFLDQNNYLYLIYAYGNNNFTSELDMIIF